MNFAMLLQRTPVKSTYTRALCELQSMVERKLKGFSYYLPVKLRLLAASSISKPAGLGEDPTGLTGTSCHLERPAKVSTAGDIRLPTDTVKADVVMKHCSVLPCPYMPYEQASPLP